MESEKFQYLLHILGSSELIPIYNENNSKSTTQEKDTSGGTRTIESEDNQKTVITDSSSNVITRKNHKFYNRRSYNYCRRRK